ncbi:unnamed protein product [Candida verbasci]|uniref:mRNA stability protein n=1 Tax=Candida verbasci TaxID=1227364 RepID=A0A9W4XLU4_9ASCO|nr:unnamed protein product [Candida verbasci]
MSSSSDITDEDPLGPPKNTQHLDLSKLSPQELKIYKMYGKLPTTQQILTSKFQDKKYFDSGDYAMQKQQGGNRNITPGNIPMRHPNAERMKEMSNRNSISAANAQVFANGKSSLLHEATINKLNEGGKLQDEVDEKK